MDQVFLKVAEETSDGKKTVMKNAQAEIALEVDPISDIENIDLENDNEDPKNEKKRK